jgi:hypothetical protein
MFYLYPFNNNSLTLFIIFLYNITFNNIIFTFKFNLKTVEKQFINSLNIFVFIIYIIPLLLT